jgi:hypothetical protein
MKLASLAPLSLATSLASAASPSCSLSPIDALVAAKQTALSLSKQGFNVALGQAQWFMKFDGLGPENPSGAYMEYSFSTSLLPDEFCDYNDETCHIPNVTQSVLMGSRDALLMVGCSPPESRYFSVDMLVSSRFDDANTDPDQFGFFFPGCPFGDTMNNLNSPPFRWSSPMAVLQTFNAGTEGLVSQSLPASLQDSLSVQQLDSTLINLWADKDVAYREAEPDSLRPLVRWSVPLGPVDSDAVREYSDQTWPVLYITTDEQDDDLLRPEVKKRGSGLVEGDEYGEAFDELKSEVRAFMTKAGFGMTGFDDADNFLEGEMDDFAKTLSGEIPAGDYLGTLDAVYGNPSAECDFMLNTNKGVVLMMGVQHTKIGMSVYNNAGLTTLLADGGDMSYARWLVDDEMAECGTWGGDDNDDFADMWVAFFVRAGATFECPESGACCIQMSEEDAAEDVELQVLYGERTYLNPKTGTGPAYDEILGVSVAAFEPLER